MGSPRASKWEGVLAEETVNLKRHVFRWYIGTLIILVFLSQKWHLSNILPSKLQSTLSSEHFLDCPGFCILIKWYYEFLFCSIVFLTGWHSQLHVSINVLFQTMWYNRFLTSNLHENWTIGKIVMFLFRGSSFHKTLRQQASMKHDHVINIQYKW